MKRLVFQSFANNEIRIGIDDLPYPKERGGDLAAQKEAERRAMAHEVRVEEWCRDNNVIQWRDSYGTLFRSKNDSGQYTCTPVRAELVITSKVQEPSHNKRSSLSEILSKPVGFTRFTRNARHRLLEGGAITEEKRRGGATGVFVTFTLPGSHRPAYDVFARCSGYVANLLCQCIRDHQWAEDYFWVYERQKRGALHLHLFIGLKPGVEWDCYKQPLYNVWYAALDRISVEGGVDLFRHSDGDYCTVSQYWRYDYQVVRKSIAGYLSKYVSKDAQGGFSEEPQEHDARVFPRRWWYMSRGLTRQINERRKTVCIEGLREVDAECAIELLEEMAFSLEPVLDHEYSAEIGKTEYRDGCFGTTSRHIFWFKTEDFADIELCLRTQFLSLIASMQKTRVTWKGFGLDYGGERLPIPGGEAIM